MRRGSCFTVQKNVKHPPALTDLARRYGLNDAQRGQLAALLEVLEGDRQAPTSARAAERAIDVHLADSLVATELDELRAAGTLVDLGSGAGLPGAVLAVALPGCEVRLLESQQRKCAFLEGLVEQPGSPTPRSCVPGPSSGPRGANSTTPRPRGHSPPRRWCSSTQPPCCGSRGCWWTGADGGTPARSGRHCGRGSCWGSNGGGSLAVTPYPGATDLHLHVWAKRQPTDERFPRRAGIARKRPLGA